MKNLGNFFNVRSQQCVGEDVRIVMSNFEVESNVANFK